MFSTITSYSTKSKHKYFGKQKSVVRTKPHSTFKFCLEKTETLENREQLSSVFLFEPASSQSLPPVPKEWEWLPVHCRAPVASAMQGEMSRAHGAALLCCRYHCTHHATGSP